MHGIECYSSTSHNHFDIRMENRDQKSTRFWWWPKRDRRGRDLDSGGGLCWGERRRTVTAARTAAAAAPRTASPVPSVEEIEAFERAGEPDDLNGAD
ncbi:MAG: hypothetical protein ACRDI1_04335 [Actinomycetota bacterium]